VALACSALVLGPALWLGPAAWASAAGLAPLAVPLGTLGLLAAAVSALLTLLAAGRHARERRAPLADRSRRHRPRLRAPAPDRRPRRAPLRDPDAVPAVLWREKITPVRVIK
jgi:hypothetical protein